MWDKKFLKSLIVPKPGKGVVKLNILVYKSINNSRLLFLLMLKIIILLIPLFHCLEWRCIAYLIQKSPINLFNKAVTTKLCNKNIEIINVSSRFLPLSNEIIQEFKMKDDGFTQHFIELSPHLHSHTGSIRNSTVHFKCDAYKSDDIRYFRTLSFYGKSYDVLNVLCISRNTKFPVLGIDVVLLNDILIIAIDYQPISNLEINQEPYLSIESSYHKFKDQMMLVMNSNEPQSVPVKFQKYFSPFAFFCKTKLVPSNENDIWQLVNEIVRKYTKVFVEKHYSNIDDKDIENSEFDGYLKEYLRFRIENDPAINMLHGAFGKQWTSTALENLIFPYVK